MSTTVLQRLRLGAYAALALAVIGAPPAAAQDEDTIEQTIIKKILGSLGADVGGPGIEYRERSPLVVPPTRELPPPDSTPVTVNPAWPKDPDGQVRRQVRANPSVYDSLPIEVRDGRTLSPEELRKGATPGAGRVTAPAPDVDPGRPMRPDQLGYTGGIFNSLLPGRKEETGKFEREPPRKSLTAPPPGYQTPSPAQPYGVSETPSAWKIPNIFDRPVGN